MHYLHLSDIHIRPLERHTEYKQVFNNLFNVIKQKYNKDEVIIFLCGDICHIRDKLLSETIVLLDYFISGLSELCKEVYIINGNHDIYKTSARLDILYGINKIKTWGNVVFLRNSQILETETFNLVYSALNDTFIGYSDYIQTSQFSNNKQSIYLYHGIVHQDESSFCGTVYKTVSEFSGFDLVLLGDLHQYHLLANNIGYCGSLIQQNFKESVNKGFIEWVFICGKWESKFIEIHNEYTFISIDIKDTDLELITNKITNTSFTEYSRIRLVLHINPKNFTNEYESYIKDLVSKKTNVINYTKQFKSLIETVSEKNILESELKNIPESQLIVKILDKLNANEYFDDIFNLHNKYKKELNYTDNNYSKPWTISELEFKNVFVYGNNIVNKITFTQELIGILGNNAIGKSCILYIIIYALFGVITKSKNVENRSILNKDSKNYYIKLSIKFDNYVYTIIRTNKNTKITKKSGITFNEYVSFSQMNCESIVSDLTCATKTDTETLIKTRLGITSKDDFIFTNIISNILYKNVLTMTNSELQETFSNLFNTKVYKDITTCLKKDIKTLDLYLCNLNGQLETYKNITNYDHENVNTSNRDTLIKRKKEINNILKEMDSVNWDKDIINLSEDMGTLDSKLNILLQRKQHFKNKYNIDNIDVKSKLIDTLNKLKIKINELKENYSIIKPSKYKSDIDYMTAIEQLKDYINGFSNFDNSSNYVLLESIDNLKGNIKKYKSTSELKNKEFELIKLFFTDLYSNSKLFVNYSDNNVFVKAKNKLKEYIKCLMYKNYIKLIELNNDINMIKQKIMYIELLENIECINKAFIYVDIKNNYTTLNTELNTIYKQIIEIDLVIEKNKYNKHQIDDIKIKHKNTTNELKLINIYKDVISEKHLQKILIYDTINLLQDEVNMIIYTLCNITIDFEITDNYKWNIIINKNNMTLGPEQCSGYERFIINTCLKIVFDKYKFYSGIKMFFIDEGLDCVSVENYDKIDELFRLLKSYYHTVIIISHNDDLKKRVESQINIVNNSKYSYIE